MQIKEGVPMFLEISIINYSGNMAITSRTVMFLELNAADIYLFIHKSTKNIMNYTGSNERAKALLEKMTLEEKIAMTGGEDMFYIKGIGRLGIPRVLMTDATQGIRVREGIHTMERSTAFPCPLLLASTWNIDLAYHYAQSIGEECQADGISFLLGPGVNVYRVSQCGRNFEYFGEDPCLISHMVRKYVEGVQSTGTIATLKHFIANNTDFRRMRSNSIVDERTLHEIYLPAFKAGIEAGAMAVMASYNKVNGEYAGQSKELIDGLLRKQLGFKWLVMSDWWSLFDPEKAVKSGLNIDMPGHELESIEFSKQYKETPTDQEIQDANVVIMSIGTEDREGEDRDFNLPDHINNTISAYAKLNDNVVVVVNAGSGVNMSAWNDKVAAIVYAWYPGQIGNVALAEILAGEVNPSGKLPITIEKRFEDSPGYPYIPGDIPHDHFGKGDDFNLALPEYDVVYDEGVFVGYRWYDHNQIQPLYPFGFGLSYTTFQIDDLILSSDKIEENEQINVQCTVRNTGAREGAEVVQLYIHPLAPGVPRPPRELKGFTKVCLRPGEEKNVSIPLKHEDFAYYDATKHEWIVEEGAYEICIGKENGVRKLVGL